MHHRRDVDPAHFTALAQASMRLRQRADARYPKRYHAKVFATHPAFQGLGAGALLLRYVMQEAANDATPLTLWSASPAKALYTHFGFTVLASDKAQAPGEDHGVDVFAMCYEA
jgi:ribosomal protein S18 acetylase RimI-like enzyme